MSERVNYHLNASGFKNKEEMNDLIDLCYQWDNGTMDFSAYKNVLEVSFEEGYRGGGRSCEEIIKEHFEEWFEEHKHISFNWDCVYIDHSPVITEWEFEI